VCPAISPSFFGKECDNDKISYCMFWWHG
jgi:hypothetical protein